MSDLCKDMNKSCEAVTDVISFQGESDGISVEGAFQYINEFHENVLGFCNNIYNAEGGTHLTGFKTQFTDDHQQLRAGAQYFKGKRPELHRSGRAKRHDGGHFDQASRSAV